MLRCVETYRGVLHALNMKTNHRRKRTKARQDHKVNYYGQISDLKRDSRRLERRVPLPTEDYEDERPRKILCLWNYF